MAVDEEILRGIERGDRHKLEEIGLSTSDITLVYHYWYEAYVTELKASGNRFPGTAIDIAIAAFGREEDRQHLYKNRFIKPVHKKNLVEIGQEARSAKVEKSKEEALEDRADTLSYVNSVLQEKVDLLASENATLVGRVARLERELRQARLGRQEEKSALDHLFETGRRVLL